MKGAGFDFYCINDEHQIKNASIATGHGENIIETMACHKACTSNIDNTK